MRVYMKVLVHVLEGHPVERKRSMKKSFRVRRMSSMIAQRSLQREKLAKTNQLRQLILFLIRKMPLLGRWKTRRLFLDEKDGTGQESEVEAGDELDAYMYGLSSQLALEKKEKLDKELSALQTELDRVLYLLKIADPTGEAAKKRELKVQEPKTSLTKTVTTDAPKQPPAEKNKKDKAEPKDLMEKQDTIDANSTSSQETKEIGTDAADGKNVVYTVSKPQWLGAVEEKQNQETVTEQQTASRK